MWQPRTYLSGQCWSPANHGTSKKASPQEKPLQKLFVNLQEYAVRLAGARRPFSLQLDLVEGPEQARHVLGCPLGFSSWVFLWGDRCIDPLTPLIDS